MTYDVILYQTMSADTCQDERQLRAPMTAPQVTTVGLCQLGNRTSKDGRHVGLAFYDLLIEGAYGALPPNALSHHPLSFWAVKPLRSGSGYKACLFVEAAAKSSTLAGSGDHALKGLL